MNGKAWETDYIILSFYRFEILSGVHHLLEHKVVHRDIKADNVFLDHDLRAILGKYFSFRINYL